jgi:uncharacterized protein YndB with AHSA1/START domain
MREFTHSVVVHAPPVAVLDAFFDEQALRAWWQVSRSRCVPEPLGSYDVEWEPTDYRDEVLGRLGGALRGTVVDFVPGRELFVADLYWHPPAGDPLGPMALEATCRRQGVTTLLRVRQSGHDHEGARWSRYYEVVSDGWRESLAALKTYVEHRWARRMMPG